MKSQTMIEVSPKHCEWKIRLIRVLAKISEELIEAQADVALLNKKIKKKFLWMEYEVVENDDFWVVNDFYGRLDRAQKAFSRFTTILNLFDESVSNKFYLSFDDIQRIEQWEAHTVKVRVK